MTLFKKIGIGILVVALYLMCAYAAQSGSVPLHIRYALSGCLFGFWPLLFIILTSYACYSAWQTRQRDSILLVITSLIVTVWIAPTMLRMSYYSFQLAFAKHALTPAVPVSTEKESTHHEKHHAHIQEVTTEKELNHLISASSKEPLVVKIFATWCGPCKQMVPNYKAVAADLYGKITFAEINFDTFDNKDALNIRGLPTIICYKGGKEDSRIGGFRTKDQLKEEISKLL